MENNLNPNSYNFRLGETLKVYTAKVIDPKQKQKLREIKIPKEGYTLQPHTLYLSHTLEEMGSDHYVPTLEARSSVGRLGLYI